MGWSTLAGHTMRTPFPTWPLLVLPLLGGCGGAAPESPPADPHPLELQGNYNFEHYMYSLRPDAGGQFYAEIWTGITVSGCATFVDAGPAEGAWRFEDGRVLFSEPVELLGSED